MRLFRYAEQFLVVCLVLFVATMLALSCVGCGRQAGAASGEYVVTVAPTPDPAPSIITEPEPTPAIPSVVKVSTKCCTACGDNCNCDPCCCNEAKKVNGVYHRRWKGTLYQWVAVRCYGPNIPCDYEWRPVSAEPAPVKRGTRAMSGPACMSGNCSSGGCSSGNCGSGRGRLFGRWR